MCWLTFWKGTLQIKPKPTKKSLITPGAVMSAGQADFIQFVQQFLKSVTATWIDDTLLWHNQNEASNGSLKPGFENISEARGAIRHRGGAGSKGKPIPCQSSEIHLKNKQACVIWDHISQCSDDSSNLPTNIRRSQGFNWNQLDFWGASSTS